jgi:hypothetical protein
MVWDSTSKIGVLSREHFVDSGSEDGDRPAAASQSALVSGSVDSDGQASDHRVASCSQFGGYVGCCMKSRRARVATTNDGHSIEVSWIQGPFHVKHRRAAERLSQLLGILRTPCYHYVDIPLQRGEVG